MITLSRGLRHFSYCYKLLPVICFTVRAIQHLNILCTLGTVREKSSIMIMTNYVEGENLHSIMFDERMSGVMLLSTDIVKLLICVHHPNFSCQSQASRRSAFKSHKLWCFAHRKTCHGTFGCKAIKYSSKDTNFITCWSILWSFLRYRRLTIMYILLISVFQGLSLLAIY